LGLDLPRRWMSLPAIEVTRPGSDGPARIVVVILGPVVAQAIKPAKLPDGADGRIAPATIASMASSCDHVVDNNAFLPTCLELKQALLLRSALKEKTIGSRLAYRAPGRWAVPLWLAPR